MDGVSGALQSGLAKLQRAFQGRPAGFPPGGRLLTCRSKWFLT